MVGLNPDVILVSTSLGVAALQRITRSVPVVFANVVDPVGAGYVTSLARPGGNITGVSLYDAEFYAKRLQILKEAVPSWRRAR